MFVRLLVTELLVKLGELCGSPITHLHCQLPNEDLNALVSITCDKDLVNILEVYDRILSSSKIRAFLSSFSSKTTSSSSSSSSLSSSLSSMMSPFCGPVYMVVPVAIGMKKYGGTRSNVAFPCYDYCVLGNDSVVYLVKTVTIGTNASVVLLHPRMME